MSVGATLAWWPGKIAAKSVSDAVAGTIDLLPTCVAVAVGKVPADPVLDGRDLSPVLFGTAKVSEREAHYYFAGYNLQAVRQGPWKLAVAAQVDAHDKTTAEASKRKSRSAKSLTSGPTFGCVWGLTGVGGNCDPGCTPPRWPN